MITIRIERHDRDNIAKLWHLIDEGWSVLSVTCNYKRKIYTIRLTEDPWPAAMLTCPVCKQRRRPCDFTFEETQGEFACTYCRPRVYHGRHVTKGVSCGYYENQRSVGHQG